jgi:hexosaminidase
LTYRAAFLLLFCSVACGAGAAQEKRPALVPAPQEFQQRAAISLDNGVQVSAPGGDADDRFAAQDLAAELQARGVKVKPAAAVRIYLLRDTSVTGKRALTQASLTFSTAMNDEGYALFTTPHAVYIVGHSAIGVFYGAQTAKQLISGVGNQATLQGGVIRDWPAMRYRGVHDDLSRGPVPTLEFQKKQIRTFAAYKLNIYSPYFENTMQYASNPLPGLPGGSMSKADAEALVEYAKPYHVTIVPEQEAFGHLHRVLMWQKYAQLAETPYGAVLAPDEPGSLPIIKQWFTELAAIFPGPFLHIGADETFELGQGKTAADVKQRSLGAVYIDFLTQIHSELAPLHRRLLFWGDVAMNDPARVNDMPKDMIAVAWHYEPEPNFDRWLDPYTKAGMETWVAPGVNNWSRLYPNNDAALRNIQGFVAAGQKAGSTGMLNTIWDDDGEGLFAADWYGVLFGAAAAWQKGTSDIAEYQKSYGTVFHGDETGDIDQAQLALTAVHQIFERVGLGDAKDSLFWLDPWSAEGQKTGATLKPALEEIRQNAERALVLIAQARQNANLREREALDVMDLGARRMDFVALKFQNADAIAETYQRLYQNQNDPEASKHLSGDTRSMNQRCLDLRDGYGYLRDQFKDAWLKENRPYYLDNMLAQYDAAMQLWMARGEKLRSIRQQWTTDHKLPSPESVGIGQTSQIELK